MRQNRLTRIPLLAFVGLVLLVLSSLGCPLLPLEVLDDPADPESENYQGYDVVDDPSLMTAYIEDGAVLFDPVFIVSEVVGAQAYRLQVAWDEGFSEVVYTNDSFTVNVIEAEGLLGSWKDRFWRVAVKVGDTWGAWTGARSFRYLQDSTVYFDSQGGGPPSIEDKGVVPGEPYGPLATVDRTGYAFGGWWTGPQGAGEQVIAETLVANSQGHVLYAKWIAGVYIVTLDRRGGTGGSSSVNATYDSAMPVATAPTRAGYAFSGYYDAIDGGGTQYYTSAMASARSWDKDVDTTLYAKWTADSYLVTLDKQGGTGGSETVNATYDSAMPAATAPMRTGFTFGGYYDAAGGNGTQYYTSAMVSARSWDKAEATTLYAKWKIPMTLVEGGTYQMGSTSGDSDEKPVHTVTVGSFYMGTYEVTQDTYEQVIGDNPSYWKGARLPVEKVTWYQAVQFCNLLSRRDGLDEVYTISGTTVSCDWSKVGYRLPTEAEWEYAALGGSKSQGYTYAGSNTVGDVAWYDGNSGIRTHDAGGKGANELGLYDMSGNVWEWCWDWYGDYSATAQTNPTGPTSGSNRVLRGGCGFNSAASVRPANRNFHTPSDRGNGIGFRLVLPAD